MFWHTVLLLWIGSLIGSVMWIIIFAIGCPKMGTLILDLSRDDKDIAQFVFNNMDLPDIAKYRQGRLEIKINHLKSLDDTKS